MAGIEVIGDSARGDAYAAVRLVIDGGRIVEADAPGLARTIRGLTLIEAAAVPGETLAADALATALAPVFTAEKQSGRVAVAMSGGVDSAVALLRAAPNAVGVTLRLWLDPAGPSAERACCSPDAVIAARETCHRLGLPHVTLDLREAFHAVVVQPFIAAYAEGLTPNPCMGCNGNFRFDELIAFAERAGAEVLWTGHYARIVERDGIRLIARGTDAAKDQSYMLATVDPTLLDRVAFPLGTQGKRETRDEARPPASPSRSAARARRPAFSPATTTGRSSSDMASNRSRERSSTSAGRSWGDMTAYGSSRQGSGAGSGSQPRGRSTPFARTSTRTPLSSAPAILSLPAMSRCAAVSTCRSIVPTSSSAIGLARAPRGSIPQTTASGCRWMSPQLPWLPDRLPCSTTTMLLLEPA